MSGVITVLHACGHEGKHAVSGGEPERRQREDWLRRQPCQACWRATQRQDAAAHAATLGLPPLVGSVEDIAWAEVLRAKAIAQNKAYHDQLLAEDPFAEVPALRDAVVGAARTAMDTLVAECHAKWWIENRFEVMDHVKQSAAQALRDAGPK